MRLTLNAPIATKIVCFSRLLNCFRSLYGEQCGPRSDCSGSTLFASILNSSVLVGNYLQQTTSDAFFLGALRVNFLNFMQIIFDFFLNFRHIIFDFFQLSGTSDVAPNAVKILDVLIKYLVSEHIDYAIEVGLQGRFVCLI